MNENSHSHFHKLVQASLDRPLVEAERSLLEAHLAGCPACRRYASDLGALENGLSRLTKKRWPAGPGPDPRILRNIQLRSRRVAMRKWIFRIAGGVVLIGIFIFVFSGVLSGLQSRTPSQPAAGSSAAETATPEVDQPTVACQDVLYTVQDHDTVLLIATNFGVTAASIEDRNGLANDSLRPGMSLVIPLCLHPGIPTRLADILTLQQIKEYTVEAGDTCASIAASFGVSPSALIQQNNLNPTCSDLTVGRHLEIPATAEIEVSATAFPVTGQGACASVQAIGKGTGTFIWPGSRHTISGMDFDPKNFHLGLDLAANLGDPIVAADTGTVIYAGWNDWGYGNLVVLDHGNGYRTYYAHLDTVKVACGQSVKQGDLVGLAGTTGNSYGPHLHFEVVLNGEHVNPWTVLPKP